MSRMAIGGTTASVPASGGCVTSCPAGYPNWRESHVLAVLRPDLERDRLLLRHRAHAPLSMRRFFSLNSLSIAFLTIFLATVVAQAVAGHDKFNDEATAHKEPPISLGRYVTSSEFGQAVMENWQSEFLQFSLYIFGTVWLIQKGSPESKKPGEQGGGSDDEQLVAEHARPDSPKWARAGGLKQKVYENSLILLMTSIFLGTWFADAAC